MSFYNEFEDVSYLDDSESQNSETLQYDSVELMQMPQTSVSTDVRNKLAEAVHMYPVLYNLGHPKFYDKIIKLNAWNEISVQLGLGMEEVTKKWKSMKVCYAKSKRAPPSGSGATRTGPDYIEAMSFLDDVPAIRNTATSPHSSMTPPSRNAASVPSTSRNVGYGYHLPPQLTSPVSPLSPAQPQETFVAPTRTPSPQVTTHETGDASVRPRKRQRKTNETVYQFEEAVVDALSKPDPARQSQFSETQHFLLSLAGMIDRMTPQTRSKVKLSLLKTCVENENL